MDSIEHKARELAMLHGSKMAYARPGEGMMINAFITLTSEGLWRWPRGLHTSDLLATYADYHWKDFLNEAKASIGIDSEKE